MENKPASLLVVSLGKTHNGIRPSLCGRQLATSLERKRAPLHSHKPTVKILERATSALRFPDDSPVMG